MLWHQSCQTVELELVASAVPCEFARCWGGKSVCLVNQPTGTRKSLSKTESAPRELQAALYTTELWHIKAVQQVIQMPVGTVESSCTSCSKKPFSLVEVGDDYFVLMELLLDGLDFILLILDDLHHRFQMIH